MLDLQMAFNIFLPFAFFFETSIVCLQFLTCETPCNFVLKGDIYKILLLYFQVDIKKYKRVQNKCIVSGTDLDVQVSV